MSLQQKITPRGVIRSIKNGTATKTETGFTTKERSRNHEPSCRRTAGCAPWQSGHEQRRTASHGYGGASRLGATDSLGIISEQEDEAISLSDEDRKDAQDQIALASAGGEKLSPRVAWRMQRNPANGLLLIYPISRKSGLDKKPDGSRRPLYADPDGPLSRDLIGLAISFPRTADPPLTVEAYLEGTAGWRLAD